MRDYHKEARQVIGFNVDIIPAMTKKEREYLDDYNARVEDKNPLNNPTSKENKRYFSLTMLSNANYFAKKSKSLWAFGKVKKNYQDTAQANYLAYLANK